MSNANVPIVPPVFDPEWAKKLADAAKETQANEQTQGNFFGTRAGVLTFGGQPVTNNRMNVVVLASVHENAWFAKGFDPSNPVSPECFAFSKDGINMVPHPNVTTAQATACDACPKGQWGTATNAQGQPTKGKACKQQRRLALMAGGNLASAADVDKGVVGILRVPVTSVKAWSLYANKLALLSVPPFAAITEVACVPDQHTMFRFEFTLQGYVTDPAVLGAITKRAEAEKLALQIPYPKNEPKAAAAPAQASGPSKF